MSIRFAFTGSDHIALNTAYMKAVDAINAGQLVVMPTDTVYGLAADAFKPEAVQRLLDAKGRTRQMPPPVLIPSPDTLSALVDEVTDEMRQLSEAFWPGGLTIICRMQSSLVWDLGETRGTVAIRLPDHETATELLSRTGPLAVSSANLTGQPAATDVYAAERMLGESVEVYLDGGVCAGGVASTIVDVTSAGSPRVLRVGAVSVEQLREVLPTAEVPEQAAPSQAAPSQAPSDGAPSDGAKDAEPDPTPEQRPAASTANESASESGNRSGNQSADHPAGTDTNA